MKSNEKIPRKLKKTAIDWREMHSRLKTVDNAIQHILKPGLEETKRILKARSEALAQESTNAKIAEYLEVVEFLLAKETYAIESRYVREVSPLENLTPLPCTPAFVLGIVNVRGEIFSVIDIKKFFDLPEKGITDLNKLIVLNSENMRFGILADAIVGVRHIQVAEIQSSLPTLTGIREKYLKGVTAGRTIILDTEKLIACEKIIVQEQVDG